MGVAVKLPDSLVKDARIAGKAMSRSTPKQIEYWAKVGRAAEDNPDLPIGFITDLLIELEKIKTDGLDSDNFTDFKFDAD